MTAPYYADDTVTLYHGDCRDIVPALGLTADLIVTDPPYGETSLAWDRWPVGWPAALTDVTRSMWVFGSMRMFLDRRDEFTDWRLSQDIVWEKTRRSGVATDRFARIHEHATHWYRGDWASIHHDTPKVPHHGPNKGQVSRSAIAPGTRGAMGATGWEDDGTRWHPSVFRARAMHRSGAINETQKPLSIVAPLISYGCPPGGTVLDVFAGSCSTLDAARATGRRAIGIELREEQCETAARRLSQGDLFGGVA
jgi:site-specific DNA-methyltransferase (adenine-specific)